MLADSPFISIVTIVIATSFFLSHSNYWDCYILFPFIYFYCLFILTFTWEDVILIYLYHIETYIIFNNRINIYYILVAKPRRRGIKWRDIMQCSFVTNLPNFIMHWNSDQISVHFCLPIQGFLVLRIFF